MCISQLRVQSSVVDSRTITCVNGYYKVVTRRDSDTGRQSYRTVDCRRNGYYILEGLMSSIQRPTPSKATRRAQLFFKANDIAAGRQTAVFLSTIGTKTYQLLQDLMAPTLPKEESFEDVVGVLKEHFQPKPLVIAEQFYFHRNHQDVGESIADFVARLRRRTTHCEFGGYLDESLRDRLVCGVRSEAAQK